MVAERFESWGETGIGPFCLLNQAVVRKLRVLFAGVHPGFWTQRILTKAAWPGPGVPEFATMYAVIVTGGKQYRVSEGSVLKIEKLEAEAGASVEFDNVLLVANGDKVTLGTPKIAGAKVTGTVQSHGKSDKVRIVKFRRRKHYLRQGTHRQQYTEIKVTGIAGG